MPKPTLKSLREKAVAKNKETNKRIQEETHKKTLRTIAVFNELLEKCYSQMEEAAEEGKFYCEVEVPRWDEKEATDMLFNSLPEFSPSWNGGGFSSVVICLTWKEKGSEY